MVVRRKLTDKDKEEGDEVVKEEKGEAKKDVSSSVAKGNESLLPVFKTVEATKNNIEIESRTSSKSTESAAAAAAKSVAAGNSGLCLIYCKHRPWHVWNYMLMNYGERHGMGR